MLKFQISYDLPDFILKSISYWLDPFIYLLEIRILLKTIQIVLSCLPAGRSVKAAVKRISDLKLYLPTSGRDFALRNAEF
jgi:hypothetical protein